MAIYFPPGLTAFALTRRPDIAAFTHSVVVPTLIRYQIQVRRNSLFISASNFIWLLTSPIASRLYSFAVTDIKLAPPLQHRPLANEPPVMDFSGRDP